MWQYFGTKLNKARYYPRPVYDTIIEPFAGAAGYSIRYHRKKVILIEKDWGIVQLWKGLQHSDPADILQFPFDQLYSGLRLDNLEWKNRIVIELIKRQIYGGGTSAQNFVKPSYDQQAGKRLRLIRAIKNVAKMIPAIQHWQIICGDYHAIANIEATWFIDPPYQYGGEHYHHGNKELDYDELAKWCRSRRGQVIVCENTQADWLPFLSMGKVKSKNNFNETTEALWSNRPTVYDATQERLF